MIEIDRILPYVIVTIIFGGISILLNWVRFIRKIIKEQDPTMRDYWRLLEYTVIHQTYFTSAIGLLGIILWQW